MRCSRTNAFGMDDSSVRIMVATTLGKVIEPVLQKMLAPASVTFSADEQQVRAAVGENLRFDVVLTDLAWHDVDLEYTFDGLDVLDLVHRLGRPAPVVFAIQGHGIESDHLDEALARTGVAGVVRKASGLDEIVPALRQVAAGRVLAKTSSPSPSTIYEYFLTRRGETAARMAGAIAARQASDYDTLATVAKCSKNTASKIVNTYLGPLILERNEHPEHVPLTVQSVYRWCGEHSRYLVSWCRRNGHADVLSSGPSVTTRRTAPATVSTPANGR